MRLLSSLLKVSPFIHIFVIFRKISKVNVPGIEPGISKDVLTTRSLRGSNSPEFANLRLASHLRLFEGLFGLSINRDKSKYPGLKRLLVKLFQYSKQRTYVNHFIPL